MKEPQPNSLLSPQTNKIKRRGGIKQQQGVL